jgi:ATP-dependent Lon protease
MEIELTLPDQVAVMTLPNVTFFPQALLPLRIFESRYRAMLRDALDSHRLFAVAGLDMQRMASAFEPSYRVATVGIVRASQEHEDGTSNLMLQGITRVEFTEIITDTPYRRVRIRPLPSDPGASEEENARQRSRLSRLLGTRFRLGGDGSTELTKFLRSIEDPAVFADLAAYNLCTDARLKQRLLETLNVRERLALLNRWAQGEVDTIKLRRTLQGGLSDEDISNN